MKSYLQLLYFLCFIVFPSAILTGSPDTNIPINIDFGRETVKDNTALKEFVVKKLLTGKDILEEGESQWDHAIMLKDILGLTDSHLQQILMEIYREAALNIEVSNADTEKQKDVRDWRRQMYGATLWLGICDTPLAKAFLYEVVNSGMPSTATHIVALSSYLRLATPEEVKHIILHLIKNEQAALSDCSYIYYQAIEAYDKANCNRRKRTILATLMTAVVHEDDKIKFVELDRLLTMRSAAYRYSRERLALLEHHSQAPLTRNLYTDADLERALVEMRKQRSFTSVNTNVALLKAHNFENEPEADELELWGGEIAVPDEAELLAPRGVRPAAEPAKPWTRLARWLPVVLPLALLGLFGGWILRRRMRQV